MKKKRLEDILNSAFGDLDGDLGKMTEAERVEHENARLVREGLRSLRDVPECQLSNERLRNAILGSAVRPRRFTAWGLAGAVACAAAVLLVVQSLYVSQGGRDTVAVNGQDGTPLVNEIAGTGLEPDDGATQDEGTEAAEPDPAAAEAVTTAPQPSVRAATDPEPAGPAYREGGVLDPYLWNVRLDFGEGDVSVGAPVPSPVDRADREPLVVVDSGSTTRNGAYKATEVAAYGDVVFGG